MRSFKEITHDSYLKLLNNSKNFILIQLNNVNLERETADYKLYWFKNTIFKEAISKTKYNKLRELFYGNIGFVQFEENKLYEVLMSLNKELLLIGYIKNRYYTSRELKEINDLTSMGLIALSIFKDGKN